MKSSKGITLIALVITIIVLLILAGVSISLVVGNNGVLTRASDAVIKNRDATAREEVELAWASVTSEYWTKWATDSETNKTEFLVNNFAKYLTDTGSATIDANEDGTYTVVYTSKDQGTERTFVIDENGKAGMMGNGNATEIASDSSNIGKAVNYGVTYTGSGSGWQILYANNSNVYIITTGNLTASNLNPAVAENSGYNGTSDFTSLDTSKYPAVADGWLNKIYGTTWTSSKPNMKCTEYLLDSTNTKWSGLKNDKAKWVIGGPTLEMLVASYNAVNTSSPKTINDLVADGNGYEQTLRNNTLPNSESRPWNHGTHYWLACPSSSGEDGVRHVHADSARVGNDSCGDSYAFRPVVCLKSNVVLTWNAETSQYDLSTNISN